mmetsp:Transcript_269/g.498  ORF Transcript_269/g.498 Transcript_269/m.498 type:complete len:522 (-) Transcript_269:1120-2685(-)
MKLETRRIHWYKVFYGAIGHQRWLGSGVRSLVNNYSNFFNFFLICLLYFEPRSVLFVRVVMYCVCTVRYDTIQLNNSSGTFHCIVIKYAWVYACVYVHCWCVLVTKRVGFRNSLVSSRLVLQNLVATRSDTPDLHRVFDGGGSLGVGWVAAFGDDGLVGGRQQIVFESVRNPDLQQGHPTHRALDGDFLGARRRHVGELVTHLVEVVFLVLVIHGVDGAVVPGRPKGLLQGDRDVAGVLAHDSDGVPRERCGSLRGHNNNVRGARHSIADAGVFKSGCMGGVDGTIVDPGRDRCGGGGGGGKNRWVPGGRGGRSEAGGSGGRGYWRTARSDRWAGGWIRTAQVFRVARNDDPPRTRIVDRRVLGVAGVWNGVFHDVRVGDNQVHHRQPRFAGCLLETIHGDRVVLRNDGQSLAILIQAVESVATALHGFDTVRVGKGANRFRRGSLCPNIGDHNGNVVGVHVRDLDHVRVVKADRHLAAVLPDQLGFVVVAIGQQERGVAGNGRRKGRRDRGGLGWLGGWV